MSESRLMHWIYEQAIQQRDNCLYGWSAKGIAHWASPDRDENHDPIVLDVAQVETWTQRQRAVALVYGDVLSTGDYIDPPDFIEAARVKKS